MKNSKAFYAMLINYLSQNKKDDLEEIEVAEGEEHSITEFYIIVEGELEVFALREDGGYLKLRNFTKEDIFLGMLSWTNKHFERYNGTLFLRGKSKVLLKKVPFNILQEIMRTPDIKKYFYEYTFETLLKINSELFERATSKKEKMVMYLLKTEAYPLNFIEIDNICDFVDKYSISRSTFYKGLRELEEAEKIKRDGKKIILLEQC